MNMNKLKIFQEIRILLPKIWTPIPSQKRELRGVHPDFFVKFDLEIAIDQQTRACD